MVLALVAVLAGIALPRYARSVARYQADATARRICADLTLAQSRARLTSSTITVTFTPASNQYSIPGMPDPNVRASSSCTINLSAQPYPTKLVSANFAGGTSLSFDGYGSPSSGGTVVVQSGDTTRTITINADTGTAGY